MVKGLPTWSPAEAEEQTEPEVLEKALMWLGTNALPFFAPCLGFDMRGVFFHA